MTVCAVIFDYLDVPLLNVLSTALLTRTDVLHLQVST